MSQADSDESSSTSSNPFNQAGIASLIIGLSAIFVTDTAYRNGIALVAPFISYGSIYLLKERRKRKKIEKACAALDKAVKRLKLANQNLNLPTAEREENEREVIRLNQLRTNTELGQYDIK